MPSFLDLGLDASMVTHLASLGFNEPTPIQQLTIPHLLKNHADLIAQAQTGSGKTAAFGLPILSNLKGGEGAPQVLVLAPTRELVVQIAKALQQLQDSAGSSLTILPIYGGQPIERQVKMLQSGVDVVIGTPGRILDHLKRRTLDLRVIRYFVLDEADEMLNMGFIEDISSIFDLTPVKKRVLLFSATMPAGIQRLATRYLRDYTHLQVAPKAQKSTIKQYVLEVVEAHKFEVLHRILAFSVPFYGLIFCKTKKEVEAISQKLLQRGYAVEALHGDISQPQREKILKRFQLGQLSILVATDVAARGIDVVGLSHVINYNLPDATETYIHRIGRTGRAGKEGIAISLVNRRERGKLKAIEALTKIALNTLELPKVTQIIAMQRAQCDLIIAQQTKNEQALPYQSWAQELLKSYDAPELIAGFLQKMFGKKLDSANYPSLSNLNSIKMPASSGFHTRNYASKKTISRYHQRKRR